MPQTHSSQVVLAFDVGTSSLRTALFDLKGRRKKGSTAQFTYPLQTGSDGKAELNPQVLLEAAKAAMAETSKGRKHIASVGMSCFWHSLLGTDAQGNPLTPIYTWADSRCKEDAARLRKEWDERRVHAETGCMLRSSFWPAKLRWLRRTQSRLFRSVAFWMSPAEWLQLQLCGHAHCGLGMATGTGLFDPSRQTWSERLLKACGITEKKLLLLSNEPSDFQGIPWFPGIGDGAASNLGSDATRSGRGAINVGTSAALRIVREHQKPAKAPFGLFCYRIDPIRTLIGGAVSNAGNLRAWCMKELQIESSSSRIEQVLKKRRLPEHGLQALPFWTAERAPTWNEDARGTISGLTQSTTAIDILQATTEAVYQRMAQIAALIGKGEKDTPHWVVSGGILHSKSSIQRLANIMNCPLHVSSELEASLRGAAIFAIECLGKKSEPLREGACYYPQSDAVAAYQQQAQALRRLEKQLS